MFMIAPILPTDFAQIRLDFEEACRKSGLTFDQVARIQGISPQQLYQQLNGKGHLSIPRLYTMAQDKEGRRFVRVYALILLRSWGFGDVGEAFELRDLFCKFVNLEQVRILRAELDAREKEDVA